MTNVKSVRVVRVFRMTFSFVFLSTGPLGFAHPSFAVEDEFRIEVDQDSMDKFERRSMLDAAVIEEEIDKSKDNLTIFNDIDFPPPPPPRDDDMPDIRIERQAWTNGGWDSLGKLKALYDKNAKAIDAQKTSALAIMGGWNSCPLGKPLSTSMAEEAAKLIEGFNRKGMYFRFVISCFRQDPQTIYYFSTLDPKNVYRGNLSHVRSVVKQLAEQTSVRRLHLIGHSYGGWLAMKVATWLPQDFVIDGLYTIDPISRTHCTIQKQIKSYFSLLFLPKPEQGCTEMPRDFDAPELESVAMRTSNWYNFFQVDSVLLHSGVGRFSDVKNYFVDFPEPKWTDYLSPFQVYDAHRFIAQTKGVWDRIQQSIAGSLPRHKYFPAQSEE